MPDDEHKESLDTKGDVAKVTDAELESALGELGIDAGKEKVVEEKKEVKEVKPLPPDQAERTELGRQRKHLEDKIMEFNQRVDSVLARLEARVPPKEEEKPNLPDVVTTPEDVIKIADWRDEQRAKKQREQSEKYENDYKKTVYSLKSRDGDLHSEVIAEMQRNITASNNGVEENLFNIPYTGNPLIDARMNYAEAKAAVLSKKLPAKNKPNVRGGDGKIPTGIDVSSVETTKATKSVDELVAGDEMAKSFIRSTEMSEKSVKEALGK